MFRCKRVQNRLQNRHQGLKYKCCVRCRKQAGFASSRLISMRSLACLFVLGALMAEPAFCNLSEESFANLHPGGLPVHQPLDVTFSGFDSADELASTHPQGANLEILSAKCAPALGRYALCMAALPDEHLRPLGRGRCGHGPVSPTSLYACRYTCVPTCLSS